MQFSDIIIIILLLLSLSIWFYNSIENNKPIKQCSPEIIYKFRPDLDLQFDPSNFPSTVYSQMFNGTNIFQGNYQLESGRSTLETQLTPVTNQNKTGGTISPVPIHSI